MKKLILLVLAGAVLALLAGCGAQQKEATPPAASSAPPAEPPAASTELEPPPAPPEEIILYTVSSTTKEETVRAEDGTVILTSRFQLPMLTAHREDGTAITEAETEKEAAALAAVEAFNQKFTDWTTAEELQDMPNVAAEDYLWRKQEGIDWYSGYTMDLACTAYQAECMVSVSGLYYYYTGGAHPNSVYLSWNFDLENGAFFGPEVLGEGSALQDAVTQELIRQCGERAEAVGLEARNYWMNHTPRRLSEPALSEEEARAKLSPEVTEQGARLCIIPQGSSELLCYEFTVTRGDETYLIYIDAATGREAALQKIVMMENGTMAA